MATKKLDRQMLERLENIGISEVRTEKDAKAKVVKKLAEFDCEGFDNEELDTMVSILETYTGVKVTNKMSDDDIHNAIRVELAANANKEGDDEEPEQVKPTTKKATKETPKPTAKVEKTTAPAKKETPKKAVVKWNPLENEDDRALFDIFEDFFPQEKFEWIWAKDGLTVKNKGVNGKKVVCYLTSSSSQLIKIWLPRLIGKTEILDELNLEYNDQNWNKTPIISQLTSEKAVEVMKKIKDAVMDIVLKYAEKSVKVAIIKKSQDEDELEKVHPEGSISSEGKYS
jgi:hypothetical protein